MKLFRRLKARNHIEIAVWSRKNIKVDDVTQLFGVTVDFVHKVCRSFVKLGYLQRLYNTPGIDYYPIGDRGGVRYLPHPDGAKNPFLDEDGRLKPGLMPRRGNGS